MIKLEKYTGMKTYVLGSGALGTPEKLQKDFPAILTVTHVVGTDASGECMLTCDPLSRLRSVYSIDTSLSEDEAIAALEEIMNTVPEEEISAEERTAAALELIAISSLPDVTE